MTNNVFTRHLQIATLLAAVVLLMPACGGGGSDEMPPPLTANAYILPGAVSLADEAFGVAPVVVYVGERLRWINFDAVVHVVVADSPEATDFHQTEELHANGGEQSIVMTKVGTTRIHCSLHPEMTGTLIVRQR